jgi:tRNA-specific 2-thiouridylase
VLDYEERFRRAVIEDFAAGYARGETPIPCIRCNERVKFADLMESARALGADALATGHYVQRLDGPNGPELHRAVDEARDQSYFLFATTPAQLAYLRFPLGGMTKPKVREIAAELGLATAEKPDSQDICFVAGDYADVVKRLRPEAGTPGDIVDEAGRVLGRHDGIVHFTIGQRKGLGLSGNEAPLFVLRLEAENRRVVVGPREALKTRKIVLKDVNWLAEPSESGRMRRQGPFDAPAGLGPSDRDAGWGRGRAQGAGRGSRPRPGLRFLPRHRRFWAAAGSPRTEIPGGKRLLDSLKQPPYITRPRGSVAQR